MKNVLASPKSAASVSLLLCLPFAILFSLLMLKIEPNFGPLKPLLNNPNPDQPDVIGSLIALGTFLLVVAAFTINLRQLMHTARAGGSLFAYPANLVLAVIALAAIGFVIGSIIIDQYPCWIGVPNCD